MTDQIVTMLIAERDRLTRAIEALQGPAKRRGRPPKAVSEIVSPAAPKKKKFSATTRRKMAAAQKARWAAIKGAK